MAGRYCGRIAGAFLLCGLATPCFGAGSLLTDDPALNSPAQKEAPNAFAEGSPKPVLNWGKGTGKSYSLTVIDIVAFDVLLNRFDRQFIDKGDYNVSLDVSGFASRETSGSENIDRAEIALTARIYDLDGLTVKYTLSRRDAR